MKAKNLHFLLYFFLIYCFSDGCKVFAQIAINEVCPKNNGIVKDEDGDFEDWIELFNSSAFPVNLSGYYLSDDFANLSKWQFPPFTLQPQKYFLVFASGKNRSLIIDHWETPVNAADQWRYKAANAQPPSSWNTTGFNDLTWNLGAGGIGYGDGDDNTILTSPLYSVFLRKTFSIADTSKIAAATLTVDYDDAFVAYLNGVEIARANIGVSGTPPPFDELAFKEHEALFYQGQIPENFKIDIGLLKSLIKNGNNVLAIEVHNVNFGSSDLTAIPYLHFGMKDNSSFFPSPPSWFDGGKSSLHTNFGLSGNGETVFLSNSSQTIISQISYPYLQLDNSFGSAPDASPTLAYFGTPTPDSTNNTSAGLGGYTADPVLSTPAGFYPNQQMVTLTCTTPGASIRYTIDGSNPKYSSPLYSVPVLIDSTTVIRARAFSGNFLPSEIVTNTYFINDSSTLPVISLSTNPANLFDWNSGIYMLGPNADTVVPFFGANFWQEWEIPAHIEYFDKQKQQGFEQGVGLVVQGNYSRSLPQKSFKVVARGNYGNSSLDYPFFADREISSYKQIILRNAGNDWNNLNLRDAAMHKLCQKTTNLDVQDYQPCLVFINGKYWGVYDIREKINKDYISENHGLNPDSIDLLQYNGLVMDGNFENFSQFAAFVLNNNLSDSTNYSTMKNWLDIENFIDYFVVETYSENGDWLVNNTRFWREQKPEAKWRHILWDLDFFGTTWWPFTASSLDTNLNKTYSFQSIMFNKLVQNIEFRNKFINRYADLLNTIFTPSYAKNFIYAMHDSLYPEMKRHFDRWGNGFNEPGFGLPGQGSFLDWNTNNLNQMTTFLNYRPSTARNQIEKTASLKKQVPVTFNVYPAAAGNIELNTIELQNLPWAGIYFDSVPITFKAIPKPGYEFGFWQSNKLIPNPNFNQSVTLNADTNDVFTAYFYGSPDTNRICINEINYKSAVNSDGGDWVELHNYGTVDVDISQWKFKDEGISNSFVFPPNTNLAKGERLVLCRDSAKFKTIFPGVNNFIGNFNFGLSSAGSNLRLFDKYGTLYLSVNYGSSSPWTTEPNGTGKTLELLDESGNANSPYNWFAGCTGGSPGKAFAPCATGDEPLIKSQRIGAFNLTNFPNPFNNSTAISFTLEKEEFVRLIVIDVYGRKIVSLLEHKMTAGRHQVNFTSENLNPGIYFYQIKTSEATQTKTMNIIK